MKTNFRTSAPVMMQRLAWAGHAVLMFVVNNTPVPFGGELSNE